MKKNFFFLGLLISMASGSNAQPLSICIGYDSLFKASVNSFADIAGKELPAVGDRKRTASTLEIKGASSCYIESSILGSNWFAEFESFNNEADALKMIKSLQSEFISCVPGMEFIEHNDFINRLPYYTIKVVTKGGFYIYDGEWGIRKHENSFISFFTYIPFLRVPEKASSRAYSNLTNEPDNSAFGKDLNRLLTESRTGFKKITGAELSNRMLGKTYETTLCLTYAVGCQIETSLMSKEYNAFFATNVNEPDADKVLDILLSNIASALGKTYVYSKLKDGSGYGFAELSRVDHNHNVVEIKRRKKVKLVLTSYS